MLSPSLFGVSVVVVVVVVWGSAVCVGQSPDDYQVPNVNTKMDAVKDDIYSFFRPINSIHSGAFRPTIDGTPVVYNGFRDHSVKVSARACVCMYVCMRVCVCVYMRVCVSVCICVVSSLLLFVF